MKKRTARELRRLHDLARRIVHQPITYDTWIDRFELVLCERTVWDELERRERRRRIAERRGRWHP